MALPETRFQSPKLEPWIMRYELSDSEWAAIKPFLPNKSRGVRRVNDRRVLNGIFWVLRSGAPWRDLPENYGPRTTCYNRFVRWRRMFFSAGLNVIVALNTSVVTWASFMSVYGIFSKLGLFLIQYGT